MKKLKKLLAVLLAVAAVCALMVAPASALQSSGSGLGYNWKGSLIQNGSSATGTTVVTPHASGYVPSSYSATTELIMVSNTDRRTDTQTAITEEKKQVTAEITLTLANATEITCNCYALGALMVTLKA